ncbi:MAG: DUF3781 domain-containing protein [Clostridiales bacterium]|nr:DUF3781 domain-containing protein [Clostridiales bacterium]
MLEENCKRDVESPLLKNLHQLHTTELGIVRIKRTLCLNTDNVGDWCKTKINSMGAVVARSRKKWYVKKTAALIYFKTAIKHFIFYILQ